MKFFLNGIKVSLNSLISANSGNLINQLSISWLSFKILSRTRVFLVVALQSIAHEMIGLSPFDDKYFLSLNSLNTVKTFGKTPFSIKVICHFTKAMLTC